MIDYSKWDKICSSTDDEDSNDEKIVAEEVEPRIDLYPSPWMVRAQNGAPIFFSPTKRVWPHPHRIVRVTIQPGSYQLAHQMDFAEVKVDKVTEGELLWKLEPAKWGTLYVVRLKVQKATKLIVVWESEKKQLRFKDRKVKKYVKHSTRVLVKPGIYPLDEGFRNWVGAPWDSIEAAYQKQMEELEDREMLELKSLAKGLWKGTLTNPMTQESEEIIMIEHEGVEKMIMVNKGDYQKEYRCAVCDCYANKWCGRCKSVAYCCAGHQKEHWKNHKKNCRKVKQTS